MKFDIKNFDKVLLAVAHNALEEVLENIHDASTSDVAKRGITLSITITPKEHRSRLETSIAYGVKRAAKEAVEVSLLTGKDLKTGQVEVAEYRGQLLGQVGLDDDEPDVDLDTGEVLSSTNVLDLRKQVK